MFTGRVVIDTNVFVSGTVSPKGSPKEVIDLARKGAFRVVTSLSINREILEVLHREHIYTKYGFNEKIIDDIAAFLYEGTVLTEDTYEVSRVKKMLMTISSSAALWKARQRTSYPAMNIY